MLSDAECADIWGEFSPELAWDRKSLSQIQEEEEGGLKNQFLLSQESLRLSSCIC